MPRQEEKLKYMDYTKNMNTMADDSCTQCKVNPNANSSYLPINSATKTVGFIPTNRNHNPQNVGNENSLLFSTTNTEKKEIIETNMPKLKQTFADMAPYDSRTIETFNQRNIESFGQINSNEFQSDKDAYYDANNDVLRGIIQEYDRVKDRGEFYTFRSTHRRKNIDLSSHMAPPNKVLGRGFGNPNDYEKVYLGEQTRNNDFRIWVKDSERIADVPYYLTALPVFRNLGGEDTRYLNFKLRG